MGQRAREREEVETVSVTTFSRNLVLGVGEGQQVNSRGKCEVSVLCFVLNVVEC